MAERSLSPAPRAGTRAPLLAMLAVLLFAAALRIHNLNAQGMWGDEGWSIWLARGDSPRDVMAMVITDQHGPVFSFILRGWYEIAGPSVLGLRWITVLFSIASVALLYRLGARLRADGQARRPDARGARLSDLVLHDHGDRAVLRALARGAARRGVWLRRDERDRPAPALLRRDDRAGVRAPRAGHAARAR